MPSKLETLHTIEMLNDPVGVVAGTVGVLFDALDAQELRFLETLSSEQLRMELSICHDTYSAAHGN